MSEGQAYNPQLPEQPVNIFPVHPEVAANHETAVSAYSQVEHLDSDFHLRQDNLKLRHLLEVDADNTIVVVGDEIIYYGGPLTDVEIPGLKVIATNEAFSNQFHQQQELRPVKAIMEGRRVVAYATDTKKAADYIKQFAKGAA